MFIVLEGIDGCGKTTHAKLLTDWLKTRKHEVVLTAEPTNSKIGLFIREVLKGAEKVDPLTLTLLFTADRYQHLKDFVEPSLNDKKIIICERYYHSTIAYQNSQGVEWNWIFELNKFARKPDLTILLDLDPKKSISRKKTREIFEKADFLEKVRDRYLKMPELVKVSTDRSIDEVQRQIQDIVGKRL
ncbi:MAG: dTMP kinase [Candidatus Altiarchaeota archaeon]|nr:dTMP kinase [Candidatus Altiarchaeota archaeon]